MKVVLQRVLNADVAVNGEIVGSIGKGFLVLFGVGHGDTRADCERLAKKICGLRIFEDESGKINLAPKDVGGELLVVSQFTLYADCRKGYRPSFTEAGDPHDAEQLYEYFIDCCKQYFTDVEHGVFGADMKVSLTNDGPFTLILE